MNVLTRLHQAPSPALRLLVTGLLLVLAFAGGYAVADYKTVTLSVDGTAMTVTTMKSRVIDIIRENGFDVSERDDLYPAAGERIPNAANIVLRRSRPLQISLDGQNAKQATLCAAQQVKTLSSESSFQLRRGEEFMSGQNVQDHYSGDDTGRGLAARILAALRSINGSDAAVTPEALAHSEIRPRFRPW